MSILFEGVYIGWLLSLAAEAIVIGIIYFYWNMPKKAMPYWQFF